MKKGLSREWAQIYIEKGWRVVPLDPEEKSVPMDRGDQSKLWQKIIFTPDMFEPDDNLGIYTTGGLVDIDLDAPEAVAVASDFLPPTGAVYGRPNKPRAHRLYRSSKFEKLIAFKDLKEGIPKPTLIEIRVEHQSMAPPSVHPDGQQLAWEGPIKIPSIIDAAEIDHDVLLSAVRLIATCALVWRYYASEGNRNDWMLALSGTLRQFGVTEDQCNKMIGPAAHGAGDRKLKDRLNNIHSTYKLPDDHPLMTLKDSDLVASLRRIWGADPRELLLGKLERLNLKHATVFTQAGEFIVITPDDKDADGKYFIRYSSPQAIRDLYPDLITIDTTAAGKPIKKKLGALWLDQPTPKRRHYDGIEMCPNGHGNPRYYNLWRGFAVEPKKGSWVRFKDHIMSVVAASDPILYQYVVAWMADAVQHPGRHAKTAIALRGGQGTGKSTFAKWVGALFGQHFLQLNSTQQLVGRFNSHLHNAILVFADEAATTDKAGIGALKRMVTEDTLVIERKGFDIITVPNLIHLILASNEEWMWTAALDERRVVMLDVAGVHANDRAYFGAVQQELLSEGGLAAMLYDLLEHPGGVDLGRIPKTRALADQKMQSDPLVAWWYQILSEQDIWHEGKNIGDGYISISSNRVEERFRHDVDRTYSRGRDEHGLRINLVKFLKDWLPGGLKSKRAGPTKDWFFPPVATCRKFFESKIGHSVVWPEDEEPGTSSSGDLF